MRNVWDIVPLANACELFTDGNWIETKDQSSDGIRLVQTGNVGIGAFKNRREKARWISSKTFDRLKCQEVIPGDCLVSRLPDPAGRSCIIPETGDKMITAVDCSILRFDPFILLTEFFKYYSQSKVYLNDIEGKCTGATRKRISRKNFGVIQIPLPPLPEQKRIVAILDEAFAGIDQAIANAEKNLANARELFESYLNSVFTRKGWVKKRLGDFSKLISTGPFGSLLHKSDYVDVGVPLVNPINIVGGVIVPNSSKLIDKSTKERLKSYVLSDGDIVIGRRGEIGRCAVIGSKEDGWICGTGCFFIRPLPNIKPNFLANLLRSSKYRDRLEKTATGTTMKNLSNKALSNLIVSIPPIETQIDILNQLFDLDQQTQRLETIYQKKFSVLAELKQSILQKVFAGELTGDN